MTERTVSTYLALVHAPIRNKRGEEVVTSVTNLDIHDISRSCKTFGVKQYFLVTPLELQAELITEILGHWKGEEASDYNPDRQNALSLCSQVARIEDAIEKIKEIEGVSPIIVTTGANFKESHGNTSELLKYAQNNQRPIFLLFGTGWGLHEKALKLSEFQLSPIVSLKGGGYNHLSVRSAVAIYLDRLFSSEFSSYEDTLSEKN